MACNYNTRCREGVPQVIIVACQREREERRKERKDLRGTGREVLQFTAHCCVRRDDMYMYMYTACGRKDRH